MKKIPLRIPRLLPGVITACAQVFAGQPKLPHDYPITPVDFTAVHFSKGFWSHRIDANRTVSIPHNFTECETTGRIDNFVFAAGIKEGKFRGYQFNDSDLYKVIEGASSSLSLQPDEGLDRYLDSVITYIAAAQEPDGYLYTAKRLVRPDYAPPGGKERWVGIHDQSHELYNAGHLYEAAVAHYLATGKRSLLEVALRNADLVCETFKPGGRGEVPDHQEIEIGLCKLYRITGREKYLLMAKRFLDGRGNAAGHELMGTDMQDHLPVMQQEHAVGHAVRAGYMYAGMADVAALTGDSSWIPVLDRLWNDVVNGKLYITGGIGSVGVYEGFGPPYSLPNHTAYCETCASIAMMFWSQRMFLTHGEAQYVDVLERTLFNGFLSGIGMNGNTFFYSNPLESFNGAERPPWYACACCPPNVVRFLPPLGSLMYAHRGNDLYINLFAAGDARVKTDRGNVTVRQETRYPWDGGVKITIEPEKPGRFTVHLRIPGWAQSHVAPGDLYHFLPSPAGQITLAVNGKKTPLSMHKGFAELGRLWKKGDEITLTLPMPVRRVVANNALKEDRGKFALQRGPIVYCMEGAGMPEGRVLDLYFPDSVAFTAEYRDDLLNGVEVIRGSGISTRRTVSREVVTDGTREVVAIPYYAWANRGKSEMTVWPARELSATRPIQAPTLAWKSKVSGSSGVQPDAVKDQLEPQGPMDESIPFSRWRREGTTEWLQYDFPATELVSRTEVYWLDDSERGDCRTPASWRLLYKEGDVWKPVTTTTPYPLEKDRASVATFEPVATGALRLEITFAPGYSAGVYEWRVD